MESTAHRQGRNTVSLQYPDELPKGLDPKLADQCSQLPSAVVSRIAALSKKALRFGIHPNRVLKYAWLRTIAERQADSDKFSEEQALRSKAELAGELHGFASGFWKQKEAIRLHNRGRIAIQRVQASLDGFRPRLDEVEAVLRKNRQDLPMHLQELISDESLLRSRKPWTDRQRSIRLEKNNLSERNRSQEPTATEQTYIWWYLAMTSYKGKWNDMYQLARVWRLSAAKNLESYRSAVRQICRKATAGNINYPFGNVMDSILSGNP